MDMQLANNVEELEKLFMSRMCEYEEKLQKVTSGSGILHPDIASLSREFSEFKLFVWQSLSKMKSQLELLAQGLDRHETAMHRKILLLHGLPEKQNEKLHETVHKIIADRMKLSDVPKDSLHVCHRLGSSEGKTRPVLVRFHDVEHRQTVWENKTSLKGTGITVSEFLTHTRQRVFTAAFKHFGINHSWTAEGKIVILLSDKSRQKIETMAELQVLIAKYPSGSDAVRTIESPSPKGTGSKQPQRKAKKVRC